MRVLLIGSRGFIGSKIYSALSLLDVACKGLSREDLDFSDVPSLLKIINSFEPTFIIYAAGINKRFSSSDFYLLAEHKILAALSSCSAKIIYLSSTLVYGNPISLPLTENNLVYPSGEYGFYKALCEDIVMSANNWLVLRLTSIVSKAKENSAFFKLYHYLYSNNSDRPLVMNYSDSSRDYLHVNLCAHIICELIFTASNRIINVSASKSLKLSFIFDQLRTEMQVSRDLRIEFGPSRAEDPDCIEIDNSLLLEHCSSSLVPLIIDHSPVTSFLNESH